MVKVILKALLVGAIFYVLVELLLPLISTGLMTIFNYAIAFVVVVFSHFVSKALFDFPIFDEQNE